MKNWSRLALVVVAIVCASVVALGANSWITRFDIRGGNWNGGWGSGVEVSASAIADYGDGPTSLMVRLDGFDWASRGCHAYAWYEWCVDDNHYNLTGWTSDAIAQYNIFSYGCFTATVWYWNYWGQVANYPTARCFPPPSGYQNCDSGLDGSYDPRACISPIIIDTGTGKEKYKLDPKVRVSFDLDADGVVDTVGWTKRNSGVAFLALDRNGNGVIDDGSELFGDHTVAGKSNGFDALRALAGGLEFGSVDATHGGELFAKLLLWHDRNQDGISQADELSKASDVLEAIGLGYTLTTDVDKAGNDFAYTGWARRLDDGSVSTRNIVWGTTPIPDTPSREFRIYDVNLAAK